MENLMVPMKAVKNSWGSTEISPTRLGEIDFASGKHASIVSERRDAQGSNNKAICFFFEAKMGLMVRLGIFELEPATSALVTKTIRTKAALE